MALLLWYLVIVLVGVSGFCWMHQVIKCGADRRKYDADMEVATTIDVNRPWPFRTETDLNRLEPKPK